MCYNEFGYSRSMSSPKSPRWATTWGFFDGVRDVAYLLSWLRLSNMCLNHTIAQPTTVGAMILENIET